MSASGKALLLAAGLVTLLIIISNQKDQPNTAQATVARPADVMRPELRERIDRDRMLSEFRQSAPQSSCETIYDVNPERQRATWKTTCR